MAMSLKPPKKGDLKKSWLKPRRDTPKKIQPEYHLITTEGISTEPAYFQGVKNTINSKYRGRVQLDIIGVGDNTLNLLQKVKQKVAKSSNIYKHVWIVYDTDDFPAQNIDKVVDLCHTYSNEETTYHALWSNQCIELWFLLHFSFIHSDLHRQEYWAKLSSCLAKLNTSEYKKNRSDMYQLLEPYMEHAISNAKKLANINKGKKASQSTPGTEVYRLIEKLLPYLK